MEVTELITHSPTNGSNTFTFYPCIKAHVNTLNTCKLSSMRDRDEGREQGEVRPHCVRVKEQS